MILKLTNERLIYAFDKKLEPILRVPSGTTLEMETCDCFENQIQTEDTPFESLDWDRVNPATGPIFIEGAEPGDVLKVSIQRIQLADQGVMAVGPGLGVLGEQMERYEAKVIPIREGKAVFNQWQLPLNPMIGVIGVAPAEEAVSCGTPGAHGGNMDNKMITEGATLYLPVFVPGALFALGDLHAVMGDGEISVSGVEIAGQVTVHLEVIKGKNLTDPALENQEEISTIASAPTLDEAVKKSVANMAKLLQEALDLSLGELTMLMSAVGQTQICQVVDPLMTARFVMPKWILGEKRVF